MSVVVKLSSSKVTYDTADSVRLQYGTVLSIWKDNNQVGVHAPGEWVYASVHKDEEPTKRVFLVTEA